MRAFTAALLITCLAGASAGTDLYLLEEDEVVSASSGPRLLRTIIGVGFLATEGSGAPETIETFHFREILPPGSRLSGPETGTDCPNIEGGASRLKVKTRESAEGLILEWEVQGVPVMSAFGDASVSGAGCSGCGDCDASCENACSVEFLREAELPAAPELEHENFGTASLEIETSGLGSGAEDTVTVHGLALAPPGETSAGIVIVPFLLDGATVRVRRIDAEGVIGRTFGRNAVYVFPVPEGSEPTAFEIELGLDAPEAGFPERLEIPDFFILETNREALLRPHLTPVGWEAVEHAVSTRTRLTLPLTIEAGP